MLPSSSTQRCEVLLSTARQRRARGCVCERRVRSERSAERGVAFLRKRRTNRTSGCELVFREGTLCVVRPGRRRFCGAARGPPSLSTTPSSVFGRSRAHERSSWPNARRDRETTASTTVGATTTAYHHLHSSLSHKHLVSCRGMKPRSKHPAFHTDAIAVHSPVRL